MRGEKEASNITNEPLEWNPARGTDREFIRALLSDPNFASIAIPSVRDAYVNAVTSTAGEGKIGGGYSDFDIRVKLALCNWSNPICARCGRKGPGVVFAACPGCYLYHYCSPECAGADREKHAVTCGRADAPYDESDPQRPAVAHL